MVQKFCTSIQWPRSRQNFSNQFRNIGVMSLIIKTWRSLLSLFLLLPSIGTFFQSRYAFSPSTPPNIVRHTPSPMRCSKHHLLPIAASPSLRQLRACWRIAAAGPRLYELCRYGHCVTGSSSQSASPRTHAGNKTKNNKQRGQLLAK